LKRIRQNTVRRARNQARRSALKTEVGKFQDAIHDQKPDAAAAVFVQTTKALDQAAAKGTIHKRTASRRKSRLAKQLNALKAKPATAAKK
jgi:small subunit ribosomal protein S20